MTDDSILAKASQILQERTINGKILKSADAINDFLNVEFKRHKDETLGIILLTGEMRMIKYVKITSGTLNRLSVFARPIVREVLEANAARVLMIHSHPQHNPDPSDEDVELTKRIASILKAIDSQLLDHLVVGQEAIVSMRRSSFSHLFV